MLLLWFWLPGILCILAIKWKISIFRVPCESQERLLWNAFYFNKKKSVLLWINQPNSCTWVWSEKWMYSETWAILLWKPRASWCFWATLCDWSHWARGPAWTVSVTVCSVFRISIRLLSSKGALRDHRALIPPRHPWIPGLRWAAQNVCFSGRQMWFLAAPACKIWKLSQVSDSGLPRWLRW